MSAPDLVVIPCGGAKAERPAPAAELYTSTYFAELLATARALVPDERIRILSGRHGFVRLTDELAPYEQRIDEPGSVAYDRPAYLRTQRADDEVMREARAVTVLAGAAYSRPVEELYARTGATVSRPFDGARGIGDHRKLARLIREEAGR